MTSYLGEKPEFNFWVKCPLGSCVTALHSFVVTIGIRSLAVWYRKVCAVCFPGQVMFAEIKMENGKSKGCGTVRFDTPESAEQACRLMNCTKINGREVDVRVDRNA